MAVVDYLTQEEVPYSTTIRPERSLQPFVMDDNDITGGIDSNEEELSMKLIHRPVTEDQLSDIIDFFDDNRENSIRISGNDGRKYIAEYARDGYDLNFIGRRNGIKMFDCQFDLNCSTNLSPDIIRSLEFEYPQTLKFKVIWTAPVIRDGTFRRYNIWYRRNNENWSSSRAVNTTNLEYTFTGAQAGDKWYVKIRAETQEGEYGEFSLDKVVTIVATPAQVSGLARNVVNDNAVLTWNAIADKSGFLGYYVEANINNEGWNVVAVIQNEQHTVALTRGRNHKFRVRARNLVDYGTYSSTLTYDHPANPPSTQGTASNPIIISDPRNYNRQNIGSVLRKNDGTGITNGTYFRFTVPTPASQNSGRWRITTTGTPSSADWNLAESDGSPASTGIGISESISLNLTAGQVVNFVVYPQDAAATVNVVNLFLTIVPYVPISVPTNVNIGTSSRSRTALGIGFFISGMNGYDLNNGSLRDTEIQGRVGTTGTWYDIETNGNTSITVTAINSVTLVRNTIYTFRGRIRNQAGWSSWSPVFRTSTLNYDFVTAIVTWNRYYHGSILDDVNNIGVVITDDGGDPSFEIPIFNDNNNTEHTMIRILDESNITFYINPTVPPTDSNSWIDIENEAGTKRITYPNTS